MDRVMLEKCSKLDIASGMQKKVVKEYIRNLKKEQLIDFFIKTLKKDDEKKIPLSIFEANLSSLELIVKYLKDTLGYSNSKIALTLNRSAQNIWITYRNASNKHPGPLNVETSEHDISVDIFTDTKLSVLESIVKYMRDTGLSNADIAKMLHRNKKTISTVYYRAKVKL